MSLWSLSDGFWMRSAFDPFDLLWPERALSYDDFSGMRQRMVDDMWRRQDILDRMQGDTMKDFFRFMNNPEATPTVDPKMISHSASSVSQHTADGNKHTFKRSVTVDGKTEAVTAEFDGEKTTVNYGDNKQVVLPGFFDITKNVIENGSSEAAEVMAKLKDMNHALMTFPPSEEKLKQKAVIDAPSAHATAQS